MGWDWVGSGSKMGIQYIVVHFKLGMGLRGDGISHFNFMKFMIKCLEGVSPGLSSVFCNK